MSSHRELKQAMRIRELEAALAHSEAERARLEKWNEQLLRFIEQLRVAFDASHLIAEPVLRAIDAATKLLPR